MRQISTQIFLMIFSIGLISCSQSSSTITVKGKATIKAPVDYMKFTVGFSKEDTKLSALESSSHAKMVKLKKILLTHWGLSDSVVKTEESQINKVYGRNNSKEYYRFSQTMTIVLDSLELYETMRRDLLNAGANKFEIESFGTFREKEYKRKGLKKAYQDAQSKANQLASSADLSIGKPQKINTAGMINFSAGLNEVVTFQASAPINAKTLESTIIKEHIDITSEVTVEFSIE